jgi:hypothetical protein
MKKNASELLKIFDKSGEQLTYNSTGSIFIDQVAVPNSNIFELFPLLFKAKAPKNTPGLMELFEKLNEMGLLHLVSLKKIKKQQSNSEIVSLSENDTNYWYLG